MLLELFDYCDNSSDFEVNIWKWHKSHIYWRHNFFAFSPIRQSYFLIEILVLSTFRVYNVHLGIILPGEKTAVIFFNHLLRFHFVERQSFFFFFFYWEYIKITNKNEKEILQIPSFTEILIQL